MNKHSFDTRWVTIPTLALLALTVGDANGWVVTLAVIGSTPLVISW